MYPLSLKYESSKGYYSKFKELAKKLFFKIQDLYYNSQTTLNEKYLKKIQEFEEIKVENAKKSLILKNKHFIRFKNYLFPLEEVIF